MKRSIVITDDGSTSLKVEDLDENFPLISEPYRNHNISSLEQD